MTAIVFDASIASSMLFFRLFFPFAPNLLGACLSTVTFSANHANINIPHMRFATATITVHNWSEAYQLATSRSTRTRPVRQSAHSTSFHVSGIILYTLNTFGNHVFVWLTMSTWLGRVGNRTKLIEHTLTPDSYRDRC